MIRRHPSADLLRRWLTTDADAEAEMPDVTAHVDDCERCAAKLEQLDSGTAEGFDPSAIASALLSLLAPPEGLSARVEGRVIDRLSSRQMVVVLGDLFGAGLETSKLLLTEEDL